jgi:iron complex transport system substrate-binding protein
MVGRSRYCDYPPEVQRLPSVGGYVDPSLEAILALQPDLVLGARGPIGRSLVDKLESRGIDCYFPSTESLAEIVAMIRSLGERLDAAHQSSVLISTIEKQLQDVESQVKGKSQPRTLLVFGQSPVVVAGPGSFPHEMLLLAGCRNAVESTTPYPTLGLETILGLAPDMIIDATMAGGGSSQPIDANRAGWSSVPAVKRGRVAHLKDDRILRPGPRVGEGVQLLADLTHREEAAP